jgi:hypothetical protein
MARMLTSSRLANGSSLGEPIVNEPPSVQPLSNLCRYAVPRRMSHSSSGNGSPVSGRIARVW